MKLRFTLNGQPVHTDTAKIPGGRAVDLLRELGALDLKEGCGTGECGACSALVDGVHKLTCLMLPEQLHGREVVTAAGLGSPERPHPVQTAFAEHGAVQCGYCTPGMVVAAAGLLQANPVPSRDEVRQALSGNLCRCTGYVKIVDAVEAAAKALAADAAEDTEAGA
jgi:carbon-monoxide dehydrogenase small subunit